MLIYTHTKHNRGTHHLLTFIPSVILEETLTSPIPCSLLPLVLLPEAGVNPTRAGRVPANHHKHHPPLPCRTPTHTGKPSHPPPCSHSLSDSDPTTGGAGVDVFR
ncbi:hypothetical protein Hanom_Chr14g01300951 [Helianthus anomalus]